MTVRSIYDVSHKPVYSSGSQAPLWWGMWGLIAIEATVFGSLIATYFYLRIDQPVWPPEAVQAPALTLPIIYTLVLLASSFTMRWGENAIQRGDQRTLFLGQAVSIVLAVAFLALKTYEYAVDVDYRWDSHPYGSIVWTITGFHAAHVISVVLKTSVVALLSYWGYFNRERHLGVQANGLYWHFVVWVWVPLFAVLYFVPRLL